MFFRKYGEQYQVDPILMAAQGYQESGLNQNAKSHVGAIGVMQLMPATGKEQKVGDITQVEPNIHAGIKYMRFMMDQYLQGRADDAEQQAPHDLRVLQRGAWAGSGSCAPRPNGAGSTRTSGSATSSAWPPRRSAARPCSM